MIIHRASVYHRTVAVAMLALTGPAVIVAALADDGWHGVLLLPLMVLIWNVRGAFPGRALRDEGSGDAPGARLATGDETVGATLRAAVAPMAVVPVVLGVVLLALNTGGEWVLVAVTVSEAVEEGLHLWHVRRRERDRPGTARVVRLRGPWRPVVPGVWRDDDAGARAA